MVASQPIALPNAAGIDGEFDTIMDSGSYNGGNGSFNPASYTRHYIGPNIGSPIAWQSGSYGYIGDQTTIHPDDDFSMGVSPSYTHDQDLADAMALLEREGELCRDFVCCGLRLADLHALLDHFEESHVVMVDPITGQYYPVETTPPFLQSHSRESSLSGMDWIDTTSLYAASPDTDDMEFDMDTPSGASSASTSPPDTPVLSTPITAFSTYTFPRTPPSNVSPSPSPYLGNTPVAAFENTVLPVRPRSSLGSSKPILAFPASRAPAMQHALDAFNGYAGYSDWSSDMPGTAPSPASSEGDVPSPSSSRSGSSEPEGVRPSMLTSKANRTHAPAAPSSAQSPPHQSTVSGYPSLANAMSPSSSHAAAHTVAANPSVSTTLSRPATALLLSKPFHCPKPNCSKSYKQANGLKYHMTHGSCNFAPPKDIQAVEALIATKRAAATEVDADGLGIVSEGDLIEVEREAERKLRPYACGISDCTRRYKNMNGLRYHYQHSGDHGVQGLALLASGQHESLQHHGRSSAGTSRTSTPQQSGASTPVMGYAHGAHSLLPHYQHASQVASSQHAQAAQHLHMALAQQQQMLYAQSQQHQQRASILPGMMSPQAIPISPTTAQ